MTQTPTPSNTVTNTATSTITLTPTNTNVITPTYSSTPTNTVTLTPTGTPTFTATETITNTMANTATATLTLTVTPTEVVVQATPGTGAPSNSSQVPGASNVAVLQIQLTNPGNNAVTMTQLTLTESGAAPSGITSVSLVQGGVTIATASFSGSTAIFNFNGTIPASGGEVTYEVVANFSGSAPTGNYQFSVTGGVGNNSQPVGFSGLPVTGATVTIGNPTSTASATPNASITATPTVTSTSILTTVIGLPFPNPATGTAPISVSVNVPGPSTVNFDVFTAAFRKIVSQPPVQINGQTSLGWDLKDNWGNPVADGLYYIRIRVSGIQPTVKILKVLVIH